MIDYFALLWQPRQPHLDPNALEESFHRLARSLHPDASSSGDAEAFQELNRAFSNLRDPRLRLQHLLALENVASPANFDAQIFAELFSRAADIANRARKEMSRDQSSDSAITNSVAKLQRTEIRAQLSGLVHELEREQARATDELIQLDLLWNKNRLAAIAEALRLLQQFAFLRKWLDTLHELQFQFANSGRGG